MLNNTLFKAELIKNACPYKKMAEALGMSERTFCTRVKKGDFGIAEIDVMLSLLKIDDPRPVFFAQ